MKLRIVAGFLLIGSLFAGRGLEAQQGDDQQFVARYRGYWQQLENEFRLAGNDCERITERLTGWVERNGANVDSLVAQSQGLMDRLTEAQIDAILPGQQSLLELISDSGARCRRTPGFREAMDVVGLVLAMGG